MKIKLSRIHPVVLLRILSWSARDEAVNVLDTKRYVLGSFVCLAIVSRKTMFTIDNSTENIRHIYEVKATSPARHR